MGCTGEDLQLSPLARKYYPWNIEVKRPAKATAMRWIEQAAKHGKHEPVVVFREDNKKKWDEVAKTKDKLRTI
jgi:hypothetical protein